MIALHNFRSVSHLGDGFQHLANDGVWYKDKGGKKRSYIFFEIDCQAAVVIESCLQICCMTESGALLHNSLIEIDRKRSNLLISNTLTARVYLRFSDISGNHGGEV